MSKRKRAEFALDILTSEPDTTGGGTLLRKWAGEVLSDASGIKLDSQATAVKAPETRRISGSTSSGGGSKLIKFDKDGGPVSFMVVAETGPGVTWKYVYTSDGKQFQGGMMTPAQNQSRTHILGIPTDLHLDANSWSFRLLNQTDELQAYSISIVWEQDGIILNQWHDEGATTAENPTKLITGGCILYSR